MLPATGTAKKKKESKTRSTLTVPVSAALDVFMSFQVSQAAEDAAQKPEESHALHLHMKNYKGVLSRGCRRAAGEVCG